MRHRATETALPGIGLSVPTNGFGASCATLRTGTDRIVLAITQEGGRNRDKERVADRDLLLATSSAEPPAGLFRPMPVTPHRFMAVQA
jgi:hypothetical protein